MTIAISVKVNDGVVLAADSAATLSGPNGEVVFVYNNANKVFNLLKGVPIGFISWGAGSIGNAGLETMLKDLRRRFSGLDYDHPEWKLDRDNYSVADVAARVREFLYDEAYTAAFPAGTTGPGLGCIVAGFSSGQSMAEQYEIDILPDGNCADPYEVCPRDLAPWIVSGGQSEAISRVLYGYAPRLVDVLRDKVELTEDQISQAMQAITESFYQPVITAPMPINDTIELAEFLADLAVRYSHFTPGAATVGGPIEIAAITKHEGFKWVRRKYYYQRDINPGESQDV